MKFRRDIGITRQIATIPFIAFAGFVAVLALVYHYSGSIADGSATIAREMDDVQNIRMIEATISEMRQAEKQYFLSADNVSLGEVFDQNDRLLAAVEKIRLEYPQADGVLRAIAWQDSLTRYRSLFEKMSNNRMTVGTNETTGLRATMRAAIHIVEREIDRIGQSEGVLFADASESLHQLRRHEKDYFLRGREIYLVSWKVEHTKLESWLLLATDPTRKVMLVEALSRYSTAFRKIVKLRRDIARQSREIDAISQELNLSLHRAGKAEIRSVTQTSEANIHAVRTGFLKLALATALIALFSLVSARLISNGITLPLLAMTRTIKGLATGKMNMIIPALEYGNEIGELARSAEIFRAHESQRHEDHALLEQEKEHTDRLIRSMTGALLEVDSNGTILLTNPAAEALLHAKPGELIGRQMAEFLPGDVEVPKNYGCLKLIQSGLSQMHSSGAKSVHDAMADSGLPMFLIDETGAIVQANALAAEATGYCHDRLPGMPINELLPKQDRANHDRMFRAFFEETEPRSLAGGKPLAARTASGSRINIGIDLIPLALDGRKAVLMITRREGIDPAFADLSPNVLTLQFSGVDLDPRVLRMLPGREDQLLNDHALSTLDGAHVDVNVAGDLLRRDDGTVSGAIFVINDISERLERDRELQRLNSALDRSASKIYMIDPETLKFTYYNQVALKRIEPLHADPADLTPMDIDPRVTEPAFRKMLQPLFDRTKKTVLYETVQQNEDGTVTPEEVRFQFIR
ncbi:MAG: PAS domain S-box protein, partial [Paracoccaceae bacterium]